jgi:hypothetical protein
MSEHQSIIEKAVNESWRQLIADRLLDTAETGTEPDGDVNE